MTEEKTPMTVKCPYDDCDNDITAPSDAEEADIIVCRNENDNKVSGCNRNVEITKIDRGENDEITSVEVDTLEVDEDWGE